ncbi:putative formimidoyltransferase-cyclodeaminase-like [Penaeus vannamei]|uniref:Putative formimidoyltransferase-cyclodeaminase-like n=1 Tax=Penaeus vannamei TaxID=6689 RepID=A0A423TRJ8_PENVA|nr:putative formimidoyltransferase-cyclodeaminase-like [Penaeus vannamei]
MNNSFFRPQVLPPSSLARPHSPTFPPRLLTIRDPAADACLPSFRTARHQHLPPESEGRGREAEASGVAERLTKTVPGSSFFLFGAGDPAGRGLVARRKEVGWFRRPVTYHALAHDLGSAPTERYGLTGVGAIPYMMNVNVTLDSADVALGRRVASALRATSPGGLPGVQSMAFPHEGRVEVACNVDLLPASEAPASHSMKASLGGRYFYTPPEQIEARVLEEAGGVGVVGTALSLPTSTSHPPFPSPSPPLPPLTSPSLPLLLPFPSPLPPLTSPSPSSPPLPPTPLPPSAARRKFLSLIPLAGEGIHGTDNVRGAEKTSVGRALQTPRAHAYLGTYCGRARTPSSLHVFHTRPHTPGLSSCYSSAVMGGAQGP